MFIRALMLTTALMIAAPAFAQDNGSATAAPAAAASTTDPAQFAAMASVSNLFELETSTMAKERATSEEVKAFADQMIADHTKAAQEMTEHDALAAHLEVELGIDQDDLVSPWHAALSSAVAFTLGALLPLVAMLVTPGSWRLGVTFAPVLVALAITGSTAAFIGGGPRTRAAARLVVGGALALVLTYLIGRLLGTSGVV